MTEPERAFLDLDAYARRSQQDPCFICKIVDRNDDPRHHVIYRDDLAIAFLNQYPTLLGYCLVAPLAHRAAVLGDFAEDEYIRLHRLIYRLGRAVSSAVPTERVYILSLGSNQGNAHVHWHVAPLPPGVPYEEQQFHALMIEPRGYLVVPAKEQAQLASKIAAAM